jgi:hypothetical protein
MSAHAAIPFLCVRAPVQVRRGKFVTQPVNDGSRVPLRDSTLKD